MEEITLVALELDDSPLVNVVTPLEIVSRNKGTLRGSVMTLALDDALFASHGEHVVHATTVAVAEAQSPPANGTSGPDPPLVEPKREPARVTVRPDAQFHIETHGSNEGFNVELLPTRHFYQQVFQPSPHVNVLCVTRNADSDAVSSVSVVTVELGGDASVKRALILTARLGYQTATVTLDDEGGAAGDDAVAPRGGCGGSKRAVALTLEQRIASKVQSMWFPRAECYLVAAAQEACDELLRMEREAADNTTTMRIGVCYCAPGQATEAEFFANTQPPPLFWDFMAILGDEIDLFGHQGFRAQLSVTDPGKRSYYTKWRDLEIMFHCCPLLNAEEQRRLVGNDVCLIYVFDAPPGKDFNASCPRSALTQLFHIVQPVGDKQFRLACMHRVALSQFPPLLPPEPVFDCSTEVGRSLLKDFVLAKTMNGYRIASQCPPLNKLFQRPRDVRLRELEKRFPSNSAASFVLKPGATSARK